MAKIDRRLLDPGSRTNRPLTEQEEWAKHGCSNNQEWHERLNRLMWKTYTPPFNGKFVKPKEDEALS